MLTEALKPNSEVPTKSQARAYKSGTRCTPCWAGPFQWRVGSELLRLQEGQPTQALSLSPPLRLFNAKHGQMPTSKRLLQTLPQEIGVMMLLEEYFKRQITRENIFRVFESSGFSTVPGTQWLIGMCGFKAISHPRPSLPTLTNNWARPLCRTFDKCKRQFCYE